MGTRAVLCRSGPLKTCPEFPSPPSNYAPAGYDVTLCNRFGPPLAALAFQFIEIYVQKRRGRPVVYISRH